MIHGEHNVEVGSFTRTSFYLYAELDENPAHWIAIGY
jgi:hypothetical protein